MKDLKIQAVLLPIGNFIVNAAENNVQYKSLTTGQSEMATLVPLFSDMNEESFALSPAIDQMTWDGTLDGYLKIFAWMKSCGCTYANAGEVIFRRDAIIWPRATGVEVARKGDTIYRYTYPNQSVSMFAVKTKINFD